MNSRTGQATIMSETSYSTVIMCSKAFTPPFHSDRSGYENYPRIRHKLLTVFLLTALWLESYLNLTDPRTVRGEPIEGLLLHRSCFGGLQISRRHSCRSSNAHWSIALPIMLPGSAYSVRPVSVMLRQSKKAEYPELKMVGRELSCLSHSIIDKKQAKECTRFGFIILHPSNKIKSNILWIKYLFPCHVNTFSC